MLYMYSCACFKGLIHCLVVTPLFFNVNNLLQKKEVMSMILSLEYVFIFMVSDNYPEFCVQLIQRGS